MNYGVVLRLLAYTTGALALAFSACLVLAFVVEGPDHRARALLGFAVSTAVAAAIAGSLWYAGSTENKRFFRKEALTVIGVAWILASLIGALPYLLILPGISVPDAVFESASGITTTGASVLSGLEELPRSLLLWRALSQWMGGLGVVVFFVAILSSLGAGAKVLFTRESTTDSNELDSSRIQQGVLHILYLYLALSAACGVSLWFAGMGVFDAVAHTFTTISTGGYSTRSASIAAFESEAIEWVMVVFMALGGTSFLIMLRLARGDWRGLRRATEVKAYYLLLLCATGVTMLVIWESGEFDNYHHALRVAAFQVVSLTTTSGFTTHDFDAWVPAGSILMLVLMMIGGCSGSTSGSTKVIRYVIAFRVLMLEIEKSFRTRLVRPIRVNGQILTNSAQRAAIVFITAMFLITGFSFIVVALVEPQMSMLGILSAVVSTLFNIGPGFAEVGPTENFSILRGPAKLYLSFLMVLGRIELFAVLVLFIPALWRRY
ncbi:MAG: TrkH family potassium uptake protein [Opitutales bacterium]|nr:TrkH family potassium uptake protein [Opitutales bacterium]